MEEKNNEIVIETKKETSKNTFIIILIIIILLLLGYITYYKFILKKDNNLLENNIEIINEKGDDSASILIDENSVTDLGNGIKLHGDTYLIRIKTEKEINAYQNINVNENTFEEKIETILSFDGSEDNPDRYSAKFSIDNKKLIIEYSKKTFELDLDYNVKNIDVISDGSDFSYFDIFLLDYDNNLHCYNIDFEYKEDTIKIGRKEDTVISTNVVSFKKVIDYYYSSFEDQIILVYKKTDEKFYLETRYKEKIEYNNKLYNKVLIGNYINKNYSYNDSNVENHRIYITNSNKYYSYNEHGKEEITYSYFTYNDEEIIAKNIFYLDDIYYIQTEKYIFKLSDENAEIYSYKNSTVNRDDLIIDNEKYMNIKKIFYNGKLSDWCGHSKCSLIVN